ncbi:MAG: hypothetical protein FJX56_01190 [Alphaproteobacteria bacterium]|nr:hypothetical protein [Alphaproteobacteria bacterium]
MVPAYEYTGKWNVWSDQDLLDSPDVQRAAAAAYERQIRRSIDSTLDAYLGQTIATKIGSVKVTAAGLLAGAWLTGPGAIEGVMRELLARGAQGMLDEGALKGEARDVLKRLRGGVDAERRAVGSAGLGLPGRWP